MRSSVLYLVPDLIGLPGGIARYCRHVCQALGDAGERITVVALRDDIDSDPSAEGIDVAEYFPCARVKPAFVARAIASALANRPKLILCGHPNFSALAYALSRMVRVPYVVFLYGTDSWDSLPGTRGWGLRRANRCIAISAHTASLAAAANGLALERIEILHNCLDPEFRFAESDTALRHTTILTVSRITTFEPLKGQEVVLAAMPRLLERFPNLVYDVVGDGDRRPALERLAANLKIEKSVRFHGVVTDEALAAFYSTDAVFVMPSSVEGFGFVFAEAMAHGMPAIGGNRDAGPEVIIDRQTGFVIDPDSVDAVVESVTAILRDEHVWRNMSRAAVEHARSRFGYQRFKVRLAKILSGVNDEERDKRVQ